MTFKDKFNEKLNLNLNFVTLQELIEFETKQMKYDKKMVHIPYKFKIPTFKNIREMVEVYILAV